MFFKIVNKLLIIVYYVIRTKNEVLCAEAGRQTIFASNNKIVYYVMRSKNEVLCVTHKTIFAPNNIYVLFFLQTFVTNYLRHVKKPGRNFK
jgi:hypothetical protein